MSGKNYLILSPTLFLCLSVIPLFFANKVLSQNSSQVIVSNRQMLNARQLLIEGTNYLHNNQNELAKQKLLDACNQAPDIPQTHHQLGIALAKLGENDAAINEFLTAIKLDPNSAASWLNLAALYQTSGNLEQSKATYQEFINRFPRDKDISRIRALSESLNAASSAFSKTSNSSTNDTVTGTGTPLINKGVDTRNANTINTKMDDNYYDDISHRGVWIWSGERMPLKVYIEKNKSSNDASTQYISILKDAFKDWANASNGRLDFIFVDSTGKSDVICTWNKDPSKFKNSSEAANAKVFAKNGVLDKGEIEILTISTSNANPITDNQMRATALHEIGHILGLTGHSNNPEDVMYIAASLKDAWIKLSNRDINTIRRLYALDNSTNN
jgi:predicted Zn-dependent protease